MACVGVDLDKVLKQEDNQLQHIDLNTQGKGGC